MKSNKILIVFILIINSISSLVFQNVIDFLSSKKENVVNCHSTNKQVYYCQMSLLSKLLKIDIKQMPSEHFTLLMSVEKLRNNNFKLSILSQTLSQGYTMPEFNENISIVPFNMDYNFVLLPLYYTKKINDNIGTLLYIKKTDNHSLLKYEVKNKSSGEIVYCKFFFIFNLDRDESYDILNPYITSFNKSELKSLFLKYYDISICTKSSEGCAIKTYYFLGRFIIDNELKFLISILQITSTHNDEQHPVLINFHGHYYLWKFHQVFIFLDKESNEIYVIDYFFGPDAFMLLSKWLKLINFNLHPSILQKHHDLKEFKIDKTMQFKISNACKP